MEFDGFDWDEGNIEKCQRHGVSIDEIELLFSNLLGVVPDIAHSKLERRFQAMGRLKTGKCIFVAFTWRYKSEQAVIRPISARYMHKEEFEIYEKALARTYH
jgi:uncharacterized DUF497 family protein